MIKPDKRNYRKHSDRNKELISKSLDDCGAGRSIVIDNQGEIIGGNGIYQAWGNKPVKIIESDGSELIVVQRVDLNTDDPKRKQLAIMDNSTSDSSEFDMELLQCDFEAFELSNMGIDIPTFDTTDYSDKNKEIDTDFADQKYTFKLEFSEEDYLTLKEKIQEIGKTPESIFYDALISV